MPQAIMIGELFPMIRSDDNQDRLINPQVLEYRSDLAVDEVNLGVVKRF